MEPWQILVAAGVAVAGGLGTGLTVGVWLVRRELKRVLDVVDRMPPPHWFQRVEAKIDLLDPERIVAHFQRVHIHAGILTEHGLRLERVEATVGDHEKRIRTVESKRP